MIRALSAALLAALLALIPACSRSDGTPDPYSAATAGIGESLAVLGWNISVTNLRWDADHVLVDVDAAPSDPGKPHANPQDVRFGLYGALARPLEATGIGSCDELTSLDVQPLAAPTPDRLTGTVCLGRISDRAAVRGVYAYSPRERIAGTAAAYPAAFPVGLLPTNPNDTGLVVRTSSVDAWRTDGIQLSDAALGDPTIFSGNGYMLLSLEIDALASEYREDSARRGGPLMVLAAPTLPGYGMNPACAAFGSSVLILPDTSREAVRTSVSLCTQGEINAAVLYATVSVVGTPAGLWLLHD